MKLQFTFWLFYFWQLNDCVLLALIPKADLCIFHTRLKEHFQGTSHGRLVKAAINSNLGDFSKYSGQVLLISSSGRILGNVSQEFTTTLEVVCKKVRNRRFWQSLKNRAF